jgi:hypothetical protein
LVLKNLNEHSELNNSLLLRGLNDEDLEQRKNNNVTSYLLKTSLDFGVWTLRFEVTSLKG